MNRHKVYGLIGYPLTHSFSKRFFNDKFAAEGIDAEYINFELPDIGDLMEVFAENPLLAGLNVTIPYKEQVMPYLDELDPEAEETGAVNVIRVSRTGRDSLYLKGYNTDVEGFRDSIRPLLNAGRKEALILGTGGASKAVAQAFRTLGVSYQFVSRTPLGMYPHVDECPDIPYSALTPEHLCYDLLYNPDVTTFMRKAEEAGAEVKNGLEMLLLQAFASWRVWNS